MTPRGSCRGLLAGGGAVVWLAGNPEAAEAHGLASRADLPIPEWLFGWGIAAVLLVSFVALALLWRRPRLEDGAWWPLPRALDRLAGARAVDLTCGAVGVALLVAVVYSGLAGAQSVSVNLSPTFVYVIFWLGLVPLSALLGDVFRAFNPWRALGRAASWLARRLGPHREPATLPYPPGLGHWPATAGLLAFAILELVSGSAAEPRSVAVATLVYSGATFAAMTLYGVDAWIERGEAFSVYFNLFSRLSPLERRGGRLGLRPPLTGLAGLRPLPGTVPLLAVMIGAVTFDGLGGTSLWRDASREAIDALRGLGLGVTPARQATSLAGLLGSVAIVYGFYRLGTAPAAVDGPQPARRFVHSLVPIAAAYLAAHYLTLLLFQGQAILPLASDPLGDGSDLFGTADRGIDYGLIGATATWYWQVGFVLAGHLGGLVVAHDRALVDAGDARRAVRSQVWLMAVMVGFSALALWLLAQANA